MADKLEGQAEAILAAPNHVTLSIPRKDGTVQSVIVWADAQDGQVVINGAEGRAWVANLRRAKTATVVAMNDGSPWDYATVTGTLVAEASGPEADDHIDQLSKKYLGVDEYPYRSETEKRVKFTLKPERVLHTKMD
jgi:PPOX class probable F420-dependent enzyme